MPRKVLCRQYYSRKLAGLSNRCPKQCQFYHPSSIKSGYTKEYNRELGTCYCGSELITIVRHDSQNQNQNTNGPVFFRVCSRTRKGMLRCK